MSLEPKHFGKGAYVSVKAVHIICERGRPGGVGVELPINGLLDGKERRITVKEIFEDPGPVGGQVPFHALPRLIFQFLSSWQRAAHGAPDLVSDAVVRY